MFLKQMRAAWLLETYAVQTNALTQYSRPVQL